MKLKALHKTGRDWKHQLRDQIRPNECGDAALLAWQIIGGLAALVAIYGAISMSPEVVRYLKIKRM